MTTLAELAARHHTDKLAHGYCPRYERHFADLRERPINLLEIGVYHGGSLRMWADYFAHEDANIFGVDIDPACHEIIFDDHRVDIIIGDVKTVDFDDRSFDVIIDDGSHFGTDIVLAAERLWSHLQPGGLYVIEDWEVQWLPEWRGDPVSGSTAVAFLHDLLRPLLIGPHGVVSEVHVYEQICFLQKRA